MYYKARREASVRTRSPPSKLTTPLEAVVGYWGWGSNARARVVILRRATVLSALLPGPNTGDHIWRVCVCVYSRCC